MSRITGQQARGLLDIWRGDEDGLRHARGGAYARYGELFRAAPDLAETVAWLYGREAQNEAGTHWDSVDRLAANWVVIPLPGVEESAVVASVRYAPLTPDEAVDLARALLAAAQEARNGQ